MLSPFLRVTIAFFQFWSFATPRPIRRTLPRKTMVLTSVTLTLNSFWTASRIWILFAFR